MTKTRAVTPFRVGMTTPVAGQAIPAIPNCKDVVRDLGTSLYMRGFPLQTQTSWAKNAAVIAKIIWGQTRFVALDVYIHHRPISDSRFAANVRVVEKGGVIRSARDISKDEPLNPKPLNP